MALSTDVLRFSVTVGLLTHAHAARADPAGALGVAVAEDLPPPLAPGVVRLRIAPADPTLVLYEIHPTKGNRLVCEAPCDSWIDARGAGSFFVHASGVPRSPTFTLADRMGVQVLAVQKGSGAQDVTGRLMLVLGGLAGLTGLSFGLAAAAAAGVGKTDVCTLEDLGLVTGVSHALGAALALSGWALVATSGNRLRFETPHRAVTFRAPLGLAF